MNLIIGPTSPPSACLPNPPIPSTGVKPFSMKNAVMNPQAMNAAMLGMIMPDRKVPNFCTATRALFALLGCSSAFTAMLCLRTERWHARRRAPPRSVATGPLPRLSYGLPAHAVQRRLDRSTSTDRGGAGRMRVVRFYAPRDVRVEDAPEPGGGPGAPGGEHAPARVAGPGDLVVRVRNCSICGTDAKIWRSGHPNLSPPRVLG